MKQHILNFVLVLVIAIGGVYLIQPAVAQTGDCPDCETCSVPKGEDPCPECFSSDCADEENDRKCGTLENVDSGEHVVCWRPNSELIPGEH